MPPASTATVEAPSSTATLWAIESIPRARPLTIATPARATAPQNCSQTSRPYGVTRRVPTTASDCSNCGPALPRTNSTGGLCGISRKSDGYASSSQMSVRTPCCSSASSSRSGANSRRARSKPRTYCARSPASLAAPVGASHASAMLPKYAIRLRKLSDPSLVRRRATHWARSVSPSTIAGGL